MLFGPLFLYMILSQKVTYLFVIEYLILEKFKNVKLRE